MVPFLRKPQEKYLPLVSLEMLKPPPVWFLSCLLVMVEQLIVFAPEGNKGELVAASQRQRKLTKRAHFHPEGHFLSHSPSSPQTAGDAFILSLPIC